MIDGLFFLGFIGAALAGLFAVIQAQKVKKYSEGNEKMQKIAESIRSGSIYPPARHCTYLRWADVINIHALRFCHRWRLLYACWSYWHESRN